MLLFCKVNDSAAVFPSVLNVMVNSAKKNRYRFQTSPLLIVPRDQTFGKKDQTFGKKRQNFWEKIKFEAGPHVGLQKSIFGPVVLEKSSFHCLLQRIF